ncbi:3185_t:CDS:2, partial [Diversispora eburnea]
FDFTIKEITGVVKLDNNNFQKIMYLRIKVFVPLDSTIKIQIEEFEKKQVSVTSIQVLLNLEFDTIPAINLQVMLTGVTTQIVQNFEEKVVINFFIENRSITVTLIGSMKYKPSVIDLTTFQETELEKHILETNRSTRDVTPRTSTRRGYTTLSQMDSTVK